MYLPDILKSKCPVLVTLLDTYYREKKIEKKITGILKSKCTYICTVLVTLLHIHLYCTSNLTTHT